MLVVSSDYHHGSCQRKGAKLTPLLLIGIAKEVRSFGNGEDPSGHRRLVAIGGDGYTQSYI